MKKCGRKKKSGPKRKPVFLVSHNNNKRYYAVRRNGRVVMQHHLVMQQVLRRKLEPGERVLHKNGDTFDNRPENLELFHLQETPAYFRSLNGRWAREFDQCIRCNSCKHAHYGRGLCGHCYYEIHHKKRLCLHYQMNREQIKERVRRRYYQNKEMQKNHLTENFSGM